MVANRPRRSALYLPASNPRAIAKARTLDCDVVILDLEDAVAPEAKADARAAAAAAGGFGHREWVVRVNAGCADDLAAIVPARPDAILFPKVETPADAAAAVAAAGRIPVWLMIETPRALVELGALAATEGVAALVLGTNDLALGLRMQPGPDRAPLLPFLAATVAAARAHGRVVLDGVWNALDDPAGLARECEQAARYGCDGKTLIHPDQIAPCNAAFSPTAAEVAWARGVVAAFAAPAAAGRGAIRHDGAMIERLHLAQAEWLLALADPVGETR